MNDLFRVWHKKCMRTPPPAHEWDFEDCQFFSEYCREGILMHWTGILDKNKKEIFEGDILEVYIDGEPPHDGMAKAFVFWNEGQAQWFLHFIDGVTWKNLDEPLVDYTDEYASAEPEVIGNIYENPKMIPVAK